MAEDVIIKPDLSERTKNDILNEIVDAAAEQDLKVALEDPTVAVTVDDFYDGSQNHFVADAVANAVFSLEDQLNDIDLGTRISQTTNENLLEKGLEQGLFPYEGNRATGEVTFTLPMVSNSDVDIPENTTIATDLLTQYHTTEAITIPTGVTNGIAPIEADEVGTDSNISPRLISTIIDDMPQAITVTNENAIDGGVDPEDDDSFRQRIIDNNSPPGSKKYYELILNTIFQDSIVSIDINSEVELHNPDNVLTANTILNIQEDLNDDILTPQQIADKYTHPINTLNVEKIINCYIHPFENQENPVQTAIDLFEKEEYATTDTIIINEPQPIEAFNAGSRKLYIRYKSDGTVSKQDLYNEIMKKLEIYVSKQTMADGKITLACIKFIVESTLGVQYFDTENSSYKGYNSGEHILETGQYFVFNNQSMVVIEEV